ncbi:hypothetical protein NDU88_001695 [Pleurodeles waltl]|uniref:Uncharacterized protein n=1 Tax=Pleurodeles waltl TaxID=8319 RepID=A0AAV7MQL9_PLEWA|nr:hypothetical protein NDU88_001695 [Pleurodeles waltl]
MERPAQEGSVYGFQAQHRRTEDWWWSPTYSPRIHRLRGEDPAILYPEGLSGLTGGLDSGQRSSKQRPVASHRQGSADPGGLQPTEHPLQKTVVALRRQGRRTGEAQLGKASQRGRGACRTLTSPMALILVVAYLDLDGHLMTAQQPQGG